MANSNPGIKRTYNSWYNMGRRCGNPGHVAYKSYGARGIVVCARWHSFAAFLADMGERPNGLSLERIDNDGPYSPENCRWATSAEQHRNTGHARRIVIDGVCLTASEAARKYGSVNPATVRKRICKGIDPITAVFAPSRPNRFTSKKAAP